MFTFYDFFIISPRTRTRLNMGTELDLIFPIDSGFLPRLNQTNNSHKHQVFSRMRTSDFMYLDKLPCSCLITFTTEPVPTSIGFGHMICYFAEYPKKKLCSHLISSLHLAHCTHFNQVQVRRVELRLRYRLNCKLL